MLLQHECISNTVRSVRDGGRTCGNFRMARYLDRSGSVWRGLDRHIHIPERVPGQAPEKAGRKLTKTGR